VTLASAALSPASPSEENTDQDTSLPQLHLIVLVDLCKGSSSEGYYPYLALVDLGTTYNFISWSVADKLKFEAVKAGRSKVKKKAPSPITTINGEPLCATAVVQ
jgi:hypothetical protein